VNDIEKLDILCRVGTSDTSSYLIGQASSSQGLSNELVNLPWPYLTDDS